MKITENIKSLADIMHTMDNLNNQEFIAEQNLTQEDVVAVIEELKGQMNQYKGEVQTYVEKQLTKRQEHQILASGIADTIKVLSDRKKVEENKIKGIDGRIDYLCKFAGITGIKTPTAEIKYIGGDKMMVEDEESLPPMFKKHVFTVIADDEEVAESLRNSELGYIEDIKIAGLPEIKKRYNKLSEEEKEVLKGKIWIDDSKSLKIIQ